MSQEESKEASNPGPRAASAGPGYNASSDLVDYIHGITYEIWEERGVDLIGDYYGADMALYTLGGVIRGAQAVIDNTWATLAAYPDRRLLAEAVVASGTTQAGFSSHRIFSPMTNLGESAWGPATGRAVTVRTVADCRVENGRIVEEWLSRDNTHLAEQLGLDVLALARSQRPDEATRAWQQTQIDRVHDTAAEAADFHGMLLQRLWDRRERERCRRVDCAVRRASPEHRGFRVRSRSAPRELRR